MPTSGKMHITHYMEIRIKDKKLVEMVKDKEAMVNEGREISKRMEAIDTELEELKEKEKEYTSALVPEELLAKGNAIKDEINAKVEELQKISEEVTKLKLANIPAEVKEKHVALAKEKDTLEKQLNKIGLKIEKFKSRYIPKIQKLAQPQLTDEFDDLETANLDGDEIVVTTFSHLELWKERFRQNRK